MKNEIMPTFTNQPEETEITEITDFPHVTNGQFLEAIFHSVDEAASPTVTSFPGNPQGANPTLWNRYGTFSERPTPPEHNNYFCVSSHTQDENGRYRRQKKYFSALHCIALDDIGSKIPVDRVTLPPSWRIETSPGNYQQGYILDTPVNDVDLVDRLAKAVTTGGFSDKGATGWSTRVMRLPVAIHGKLNPPWHCRLVTWEPSLHYSVSQIIDGLDLALEAEKTAKKSSKKQATLAESIDNADQLFTPRPDENPVLVELKKRGLYKTPLGSKKHDVTCPWKHEHTDGLDTGACYHEPDADFPIGWFRCQHSHGDRLKTGAFLEFLDVKPTAARMLPTVKVVSGELHRIVTTQERLLAESGNFYQRGGLIVSISQDPTTNESQIVPTSLPAITRSLSSLALWERFDGRNELWLRTDPPARHCGILFDAQNYDHLPPLAGIARQPYLRSDGSIMGKSGYDHQSGFFGVFNEREFSIPANPSKEDAQQAAVKILGLLEEFSFASLHDKAAAVAMLITAAIRPGLPTAPMIHITAPVMGSGKSFGCKLATAFATPAPASPVSFPPNDEECAKLLLSLLLKSPPVIEFDDLNGDIIPFDKLKTAITEESISGRILGVSKDATVSTRVLILSSGNNVGPIRDMTRRVLTINIDPACESPATRHFKRPDLLKEVKRDRGQYVSAALTIVKAWTLAGKPRADIPALASFGDWSGYCRHSLVWLGLPDPAARIFEQMADDPDADVLRRFMSAWFECFGTRAAGVRDLVERSDFDPKGEVSSVIREIAEERGGLINRRTLGRWIKRHEGRFIDDMRIIPERSAGRNASAWTVKKSVTSVTSVISRQVVKDGEKEIPLSMMPWAA
ncbi:MAG: hypothetical protein PHV02_16050 [Rhodocyclaceae bacterium]|nr:hypothetical protein [Rhodocyclaceae bacterium]